MIEPTITLCVETLSYPQIQLSFLTERIDGDLVVDSDWVLMNKVHKDLETSEVVTEFISDNPKWIRKKFLKLVLARYFELKCRTEDGTPAYTYVTKNEEDLEVLTMLREQFHADDLLEIISMFEYLHEQGLLKIKKNVRNLISTALDL